LGGAWSYAHSTLNVTGGLSNEGSLVLLNGSGGGGSSAIVNGIMTNSGLVDLGTGTFLTAKGGYTQSGSNTITDVDGTLMAPSIQINGGNLGGGGTIEGLNGGKTTIALTDGGTFAPSDPLTLIGTLSMGSHSVFDEAIYSGTLFGALDLKGDFTISHSLLSLEPTGFTPTSGETFEIVDASLITGHFSDNTLGFAGGTFDVSYDTTGCATGYADCIDLTWEPGTTPTPEPTTLFLTVVGLAVVALRKKLLI
jgi:hypothetical protein